MQRTYVGIDLAAQPRSTAVAVLVEDGNRCRLDAVVLGAEDQELIAAVRGATKAGIDVPLGWPRRFVDLLTAHAARELPAPESTGDDWRRGLAMRETDLEVRRRTGLNPLSVATDRIAHPALRWAGIEARLRDLGLDAARDGSGAICEVYPAAALRIRGLTHRGYKGAKNHVARAALVDALSAQLPRLDWNGHRGLCECEDDALDAVLAALIAREVDQGRAAPPRAQQLELARQEGWIWLPRAPLPGADA